MKFIEWLKSKRENAPAPSPEPIVEVGARTDPCQEGTPHQTPSRERTP